MDLKKEIDRRYKLQEEYLGTDKPINRIQPLVSVRIATYQHVNYIKDCIEGALMQKTTFPFEIIIGEDQSTDGTRDICIDYANKYPDKIRLFLRDRNTTVLLDENGNFKKSINSLFNVFASRGKYQAICEGDDYWTAPYKLQKQVDLMEEYTAASSCVALCSSLIHEKGEYIPNIKPIDEPIKLLELRDINHYFHTSTYLIRSSVLRKITDEYPHLLLGDTALRYLMLAEGPFVLLNEEVSVYRQTGGGVWSSLSDYNKNKKHYNLYNKLRRYHIKPFRNHYLKREIHYQKKVINNELTRKDFFYCLKLRINYFFLLHREDKVFVFRSLYKKLLRLLSQ